MKYVSIAIYMISLSCVPATVHKTLKYGLLDAYSPETTMVASWYGPGFYGNKTSSGEVYTGMEFTCAHKTLPFGTRLLIIPEWDTTKACIVRVNDRGPYIKGRDLDLSYSAAKYTGLLWYGVGKFKVKILGKEES